MHVRACISAITSANTPTRTHHYVPPRSNSGLGSNSSSSTDSSSYSCSSSSHTPPPHTHAHARMHAWTHHACKHASQPAGRQACRQAGRQAGGHAEKQAYRKNFGVLLERVRFFFCTITFAYVRPTCRLSRTCRNLEKVRPPSKVS
jgi:hypothetical protein